MSTRKNALLSVADKTGIAEFATDLITLGWRIISSGGTAKALRKAGLEVTDVADISGLPAVLGHRVVTLVPHVHGGLLAAETMLQELEELGYPWIDLVCVDFYPLEEEVNRTDATTESVIEKTDIGGPTMVRSGAKGRRIVVTDSSDRNRVLEWLKAGQPDNEVFRNELAAKAEAIIANYCLTSARFHSGGEYEGFIGHRVVTCKYGENAWQTPAHLYSTGSGDPLALDKFELAEGSPPGFNNWCDLDRLLQTTTHVAAALIRSDEKSLVAVGAKHGNPCGAAVGTNGPDVAENMMHGDDRAIFGGLVMTNFVVDSACAKVLAEKPLDGVVAPGFTDEARERLTRKGGKCRFLINPALQEVHNGLDQAIRFRFVRGGFLVQPNYTFVPNLKDDSVEKYGQATIGQEQDMLLAWAVGSTSNSNTVTIVKDGQLLGNGTGQQDRVGAAKLATEKAVRNEHDLAGAVAYSDSFFPFDDGPRALIKAGVTAIFTSSGSVWDEKTISACQEHGVALYMVPDEIGRGFFGH